jgi:hypothetical protein
MAAIAKKRRRSLGGSCRQSSTRRSQSRRKIPLQLRFWAPREAGLEKLSMHRMTADLGRQALLAILACALLASALSAGMSTRRWRSVGAEFEPPLVVKSVWLDRASASNEAKPRQTPPTVAQKLATPAKAQSVATRRACPAAPCQRLAGLAPRRQTARQDATAIKISLVSAPAPDAAPSFSDRLLSPVGSFRDRMFGLISSL